MLGLAAALVALVPAPPASAFLPEAPVYDSARISIVGCSQGRHVFWAYDQVTTRHLAFDDAHGGYHLAMWAVDGPAWDSFDQHPPEKIKAVFFPLCIHESSYTTDTAAWTAFLQFHTLLRQRTQAPLWLSPTNGSQSWCPGDDDAQQQFVFERAVKKGLVARSMVVPAASHPDLDGCHFDTALSSNVGLAVRDFLESR